MCITRAAFHEIGMLKITYAQATPEVLEFLQKDKVKILHLTRSNLIRVAVSQVITGMQASRKLTGRPHTFERLPAVKVSLNPATIVGHARRQQESISTMRGILRDTGCPVLPLTYSEIVGAEGFEAAFVPKSISYLICEFLGVRALTLTSDLKRVHAYPLSEILTNWTDFEAVVRATEFGGLLDAERLWN